MLHRGRFDVYFTRKHCFDVIAIVLKKSSIMLMFYRERDLNHAILYVGAANKMKRI